MPTIQFKDAEGKLQKYTDVNTLKVTGENTNEYNAVEYAGLYRGMGWYMLDTASEINKYYQCIQKLSNSSSALAPGVFSFFNKEAIAALAGMSPFIIVCCEKGHNVGEWCQLLNADDPSQNFTWVTDPNNP